MYAKRNYRQIFLDMHIDDWHEDFLSKLNPEKIIRTVKDAGAQSLIVKAKPHTGLCYWPCSIGRMHKGLKGKDYVGRMIELCHENGIDAFVYYSQNFDNWAYDNHPSWRTVYADGSSSREKEHTFFVKGRYGVVCPNNLEYREYVKANLQELNNNYSFEGMWLDMPFWPEVCYCASCKERYLKETGCEIPKIVDWDNEEWLRFHYLREKWMSEFTAFSTNIIKKINPHVNVEHNFATGMYPWQFGSTELIMNACDDASGDLYGGYLEQTFACKYFKNVSRKPPFSYITSRCDPDLRQHTTTKTKEELLQHSITALVHNGRFSICDGMNPNGTMCEDAYSGAIKYTFENSGKYEDYVNGNILSNVSIWYATHSKLKKGKAKLVSEHEFSEGSFCESKIKMAQILREYNVPFDVIGNRKLKDVKDDILVISDVALIRDDEMKDIERYVKAGGNLYLSGHIGNKKVLELLEIEDCGLTEHDFTYMRPTEKGKDLFEGFSKSSPLTVNQQQHLMKVKGEIDVLATITLPYTLPSSAQFAAIHTNPPGIHTDWPAVLCKKVGKGNIMWVAAPIEQASPHMSRKVVYTLLNSLCSKWAFYSNAPSFVEILGWKKDGKLYFAAINQQENTPIAPMYDIYIEIQGKIKSAKIVEQDAEASIEYDGENSRIKLPKIDIFQIIELKQ